MVKFTESSYGLPAVEGVEGIVGLGRKWNTLNIQDEDGYTVGDIRYEKKANGVVMIDMIKVYGKDKRMGYGTKLLEELIRRTCPKYIEPNEDGYTDEGDEFMGSFAYNHNVRFDGWTMSLPSDTELLEGCD